MARRVLIAGLVAALTAVAAACTPDTSGITTGKLMNETLSSGRSYLLFVPSSYSTRSSPAPLILSYHGGNRNASQQAALDLLTSTFFNVEYVVAYPQGINDRWQGVPGVTTNDTAFTASILSALSSKLCLDSSRIFATGKSDGAGFVGDVLACDAVLSRRVAAVAPVSGAFYAPNNTDRGAGCDPYTVVNACNTNSRVDIPVIEFHGGNDTTIPYGGGVRRRACLPYVPHWVQIWAGRDGLGTANSSYNLTADATVYQFGAGAEGGVVTHVFDGGSVGHSWPATIWNDDNEHNGDGPASFNASSVIVEFFQTWSSRGRRAF
ncbi:Feruloyl esterase B [Parachaetomium inaequale]|uniref:feruloyl esterase n=1 Tax=Parachaetomium inaequale TaxID=2588326 RepID=A0AAN6PAQ7_9PEZI|nr:Feruloyl esterase B [Parachaetomium inaequale]